MLLGKRPRPAMKRTTSLKEFTFDLNTTVSGEAPNPFQPPAGFPGSGSAVIQSLVSPRNIRRASVDFETSQFLRSCSLCKRRLVPSRDLYMYRGDTAFCSNECRQHQMNQDEGKETSSSSSSSSNFGAASLSS